MSAKDPREELEVRQIAKLERRRSSLRTFKPPGKSIVNKTFIHGCVPSFINKTVKIMYIFVR